jgi:hypothetical protein
MSVPAIRALFLTTFYLKLTISAPVTPLHYHSQMHSTTSATCFLSLQHTPYGPRNHRAMVHRNRSPRRKFRHPYRLYHRSLRRILLRYLCRSPQLATNFPALMEIWGMHHLIRLVRGVPYRALLRLSNANTAQRGSLSVDKWTTINGMRINYIAAVSKTAVPHIHIARHSGSTVKEFMTVSDTSATSVHTVVPRNRT